MKLDKLLTILAFACFVVAFICTTGSGLILGLGAIGWIAAGLALWTLTKLCGGVRLRK
jgi:hypothetical protein